MEQKLNQELLDKLTKVCVCKGIPRSKIKKVIQDGAKTVDEVNNKTGAGSGGCGGKRCGEKIQEFLEEYKRNEF